MLKTIQRFWLAHGPGAWAIAPAMATALALCKRRIPKCNDSGLIELFAIPSSAYVDEKLAIVHYNPSDPSPKRIAAFFWTRTSPYRSKMVEIPLDITGAPLKDFDATLNDLTSGDKPRDNIHTP